MKKFQLLLTSLLMLSAACSCSSDDGLGKEPDVPFVKSDAHPVELTAATRSMAADLKPTYIKFTTDVVKASLAENSKAPHVVVSPLSATMLFGLLANGVDDGSRDIITDYFGMDDLATFNQLCSSLLTGLPEADNLVSMNIGNSVWVNKYLNHSLTPDYLYTIEGDYQGGVFSYDFVNDFTSAKKAIDRWCRERSGGILPTLNQPLWSTSPFLMLNAVYFKAPWDDEIFMGENTAKGVFHGTVRDEMVDMMKSHYISSHYYKDDDFDYFKLWFGNRAYSMTIVMPSKDMSVANAADMLTYDNMEKFCQEAVDCKLRVTMPKFKVETNMDVLSLLAGVGLGKLNEGVQLTMFGEEPERYSPLIHQSASFSVDEDGAVVASQTSGEVLNTAVIIPGGEYEVSLDRPFFFFITERSTDACVLSGCITNLQCD